MEKLFEYLLEQTKGKGGNIRPNVWLIVAITMVITNTINAQVGQYLNESLGVTLTSMVIPIIIMIRVIKDNNDEKRDD